MDNTAYLIAFVALGISFFKSKEKTLQALKKAWKSFENILPQFLSILLLIGFVLSILTPQQISSLIGGDSGWWGVMLASILGSITLIPGFIAFPLAAALIQSGAGYMQIAAFISTLMMVGIVTIPMEIKFFGKKAAYLRNGLAFIFSLLVALIMGVILK
ncbi:MAG: permease [Erysipelotrichaceae bacterium]|jgi:uncharacterized membrane protein YraQ (UPF0718 family)|nr:permease [Erysipelotrichaceae bacterium]